MRLCNIDSRYCDLQVEMLTTSYNLRRYEDSEAKCNFNHSDETEAAEGYDEFYLLIPPIVALRASSSKFLCYK